MARHLPLSIVDGRCGDNDAATPDPVGGSLTGELQVWYDNEWGYSSQLVREALRIAREMDRPSVMRAP